jgi:methionyl-tRNA synthetase
MAGNDVLMVSGTDEHGTPILVQADAEGVSARELADRYNRVIVVPADGGTTGGHPGSTVSSTH